MKKLIELENGDIALNTLLSSRTYYNHSGFNCCVYCHKEIEPYDWYIYKSSDNIPHWVNPTVCNCELAQKEIALKSDLIEGLTELDIKIDEKLVNQITLDEKIKRLKEEFDDED